MSNGLGAAGTAHRPALQVGGKGSHACVAALGRLALTVRRFFGPRVSTRLGKHLEPTVRPLNAARCLGHRVAILNSSAVSVALVWTTLGARPSCLAHPKRPWAKRRPRD
ncbi:hypothetical protein TRVL_08100 [Trypanosoma vivax]|nr:hypothetical protein TRVL_08100 [Trypanosoma vivax]